MAIFPKKSSDQVSALSDGAHFPSRPVLRLQNTTACAAVLMHQSNACSHLAVSTPIHGSSQVYCVRIIITAQSVQETSDANARLLFPGDSKAGCMNMGLTAWLRLSTCCILKD